MTRRKFQRKEKSEARDASAKDQLISELKRHKTQYEQKIQKFDGLREQLEIYRNRLAQFYDSSVTGHVTFDSRTQIQTANRTAADFLGKTIKQMIGVPFSVFVANEQLGQFFEHLRHCHQSLGEKFQIELDFVSKKKEKIKAQLLTVAILERGEVLYQTTVVNIRPYKMAERIIPQSEEFSEAMIQTVRYPLVVLDESLNIIVGNAAFYGVFNYRQNRGGRGFYFAKQMGGEFAKLADRLREVFKEQKGFDDFEFHLSTPTGHPRVLVLSGHPLSHKTELGPLLLLGMEDITHRREAEEVREHLVAELGKLAHELEDRVNKRTAELREANAKLQTLTARMLEAQELERRHIARELHDEVGQQITCLQILTQQQFSVAPPPLKRALKETQTATTELLKTVRQLSSELRPQLLDDFGVVAALDWHIKRFRKRTGIEVEFVKKDFQEDLLNSFFRSVVFRVAQEALTNVARHGNANKVSIELSTRNGLCRMKISDEGTGFDVKEALRKGAYGLTGMQERVFLAGGKLKIDSARKKGTTVALEIPLISLQGNAVNPEGAKSHRPQS
jgi:PAS domain S-box-containing protein